MASQTDNFGMTLGTTQDLFMMEENVSTVFDFIPPQQQHQFVQFDHQVNFSFGGDQNQTSMSFCDTILEQQRVEFQQLINLEYERLRLAIHEHRKQQTALLLKRYESKARFLLKQKDDEIVKANNRTLEFQNILARMKAENQMWHRVAQENEAIAVSLRDRIEQLSPDTAEDAESYCLNGGSAEGEKGLLCRCCTSRNSCIVILPCRHLCSCQSCEVFIDSCPVCRMPKKAAIQALF